MADDILWPLLFFALLCYVIKQHIAGVAAWILSSNFLSRNLALRAFSLWNWSRGFALIHVTPKNPPVIRRILGHGAGLQNFNALVVDHTASSCEGKRAYDD